MSDKLILEIKKEAERIIEDTTYSSKGHFATARLWNKFNYWLGIPATILASLSGVSIVTEYYILSGIIAIIVAILTGIMTFLNPSKNSSIHLEAGNLFTALIGKARVFSKITCVNNSLDELISEVKLLQDEKNELNHRFPQIPRWAYNEGKKNIEDGETEHSIDN